MNMKPLTNTPQKSGTQPTGWEQPFDKLRRKWGTVPTLDNRVETKNLLNMPDDKLLAWWYENREQGITGENFNVRGWYHLLYKEILRGKQIVDVGCGLGIDGITFAQNGASVTFVDIVESNLALVSRICNLLKISQVDFFYLKDINALAKLRMYDVIWCQGSIHNAPFEVMRIEAMELLKHLKIGGRWIQLAYPKSRWERDGKLSFEKWGEKTDGEGTPWCEWYDLEKLLRLLQPARFHPVLNFNFHNDDFNWFDLVREG